MPISEVVSVIFPFLKLFFQAEDGIRDAQESRGLGDVYKRQVVICLERGADLHMAQLMPLPVTVSCFSIIQIGFTFLVPDNPGGLGQRAVKRVCVCWLVGELVSRM